MTTWEQERAEKDLCMAYVAEQARWCRNKRHDGRYCKRHVVAQLVKYEDEHPGLAWYLKYRHLAEE